MSPPTTHPEKPAGFTLIELLLFMGLLSAFLVVITNIFISVLEEQLRASATSTVQADGRFLVSRLSYDLRRAASVTTPATAGQSGSTLALTISGATHTYSLSDGVLSLTTPAGTFRQNSYDTQVSDLSFTRLGDPPGQPSILLGFTLTSQTFSQSYSTTVTLR